MVWDGPGITTIWYMSKRPWWRWLGSDDIIGISFKSMHLWWLLLGFYQRPSNLDDDWIWYMYKHPWSSLSKHPWWWWLGFHPCTSIPDSYWDFINVQASFDDDYWDFINVQATLMMIGFDTCTSILDRRCCHGRHRCRGINSKPCYFKWRLLFGHDSVVFGGFWRAGSSLGGCPWSPRTAKSRPKSNLYHRRASSIFTLYAVFQNLLGRCSIFFFNLTMLFCHFISIA